MKKLLLFVLAVMGFAACTQDVEVSVIERHDTPETITVGFEGDDTRIQLNEAQKTVWTKGDLVSVFYKSDGNDCYKFTGETGERNGTLQRVSVGEYSRRGDYVIVAYPYNPDYLISLASNTIETSLPAVQEYAAGSYGVGSSPMVAMGDYKQFSLKNTCGWLKLKLTGNGEYIRSIKFKGNNGEQVAGDILIVAEDASVVLAEASIDVNDDEVGGTLLGEGSIIREVTLKCAEGVKLGAEATDFYIALPPQTFDMGFTIDVECYGCKPVTISTSNKLTIERNHIQPMAVVNMDVELEPNEDVLKWLGTWTVNSHEVYVIESSGDGTVKAQEDSFTVVISPCVDAPYDVKIEGWSVLGDDYYTYGEVNGNTLSIMNGVDLGLDKTHDFNYYWLGWYDFGLSIDKYPSNIVTLNGYSATSTNKFIISDRNHDNTPVTCFASDLFGVTENGSIYFLIEKFPAIYRTGDMEWKHEKYVDISVNFDSVVNITGNELYESQYPSAYYAAISIEANPNDITSVTMWYGEKDIVDNSGLEPEYIITNYGVDVTEQVIADLRWNGKAILGPYNCPTGSKCVAMLLFETIYGETRYMEVEYTLPNGTGVNLGDYCFSEGNYSDYMRICGSKENGVVRLIFDEYVLLGVIDIVAKTITFNGYDYYNGWDVFNQVAFYYDTSRTMAYGIWSCSDEELQNRSNLVLSFDENGTLNKLNNYFAMCIYYLADSLLVDYGFFYTPAATITKVEDNVAMTSALTTTKSMNAELKMSKSDIVVVR